MLNRAFGSLLLHEITAHRIEQYKRERLVGKWRGHLHASAKPIRPATVNRELDTLRGIFSKAVEWGKLLEHPMRPVKRLKVDNRRTRILTEDEQARLLAACPRKLGRMVTLALLTGARIGELLALRWEDITDEDLTFMETKNGRMRRLPMAPALKAVLDAITHTSSPWVFTNARTHDRYSVNGVRHVFNRAVERAGIETGDVTLHTLRHTALSRMIASGFDDYSVMEISGHSVHADAGALHAPDGANGRSARSRVSRRPWAESGPNAKRQGGKSVVDGRRLELPTSALRTRRSPN